MDVFCLLFCLSRPLESPVRTFEPAVIRNEDRRVRVLTCQVPVRPLPAGSWVQMLCVVD